MKLYIVIFEIVLTGVYWAHLEQIVLTSVYWAHLEQIVLTGVYRAHLEQTLEGVGGTCA